ncbi:MAG: hypothetical protein LBO79_04470, partial [Zoogloeaceae bacterium]|nr:hypothetical protein [Zoogloeaceae bacterium]
MKRFTTRHPAWRIVWRIVLAAWLSVSGATVPAQAQELRISTQRTPLYAPLYVARNLGWLDEELNKASPGTKAVINI